MSIPTILKEVYKAYIEHFDEPSKSIVFDDGQQKDGFPSRIDVFIWEPDEDVNITTFSTIGMSTVPMSNGNRSELNWSIRRKLDGAEQNQACTFLANIAMYPFYYNCFFDWWHTVNEPGNIPIYMSAETLLLHPAFIEDGFDTIETTMGTVK